MVAQSSQREDRWEMRSHVLQPEPRCWVGPAPWGGGGGGPDEAAEVSRVQGEPGSTEAMLGAQGEPSSMEAQNSAVALEILQRRKLLTPCLSRIL